MQRRNYNFNKHDLIRAKSCGLFLIQSTVGVRNKMSYVQMDMIYRANLFRGTSYE